MNKQFARPDKSLDRFHDDAEHSYTMPARIYCDPEFLEQEERHVFWKSWIYAGHISSLKESGDYITLELAGQRIFIIRQSDGDLGGYFNVCQHRGHSLLKGCGKAHKLIVCPYHGWSYDHSGALIAARNCDQVAGFKRDDFNLPAIQVNEIAGFVFVNLDPLAKPMHDIYPGAEDKLREFCAEPESLIAGGSVDFDIKGNWKNVGDNLLECYHCSTAHKAFVDLVDMDTYHVETHKYWSIQYGTCRPGNSAYNFDNDHERQAFVTLYLWPNMSFTQFPGTDGLAVFAFYPTSAEETHQIFAYHQPQPELTQSEAAALKYFADILGPEDVRLVEDVQQGLHSLGYHQGRIMVDANRSEISEHALHHFQNLVMSEMKDFV